MAKQKKETPLLEKAATGIKGLDELTFGGLPRGRATLVAGGPGCGKTLLALEFLLHGANKFNEPGAFIAFEETETELAQNIASLGFDLPKLVKEGKLFVDYIHIERSEIEETGEYDLEGLFVRLALAISTVKAKRIVLDTAESLFAGLPNELILRSELRRLLRWLKDKGMTTIITGERDGDQWTRHGIEEYVSDCVILLDNRVVDQITTRRLRIAKYRGSHHGTNEYPFLIDEHGISVLPITSLGLAHGVSEKYVTSGVEGIDLMLDNKGYFEGSSVLITGMAGTGKSGIATYAALAACNAGKKVAYFSFEESPMQIVRNMKSMNIDLTPCLESGKLQIHSSRPSLYGLEMHLLELHKQIEAHNPQLVIIDPITNLEAVGGTLEIRSMLTRIIDFLKSRNVTCISTGLLNENETGHTVEISSLMDTWILLKNKQVDQSRIRTIEVVKSRGMAHSSKVRRFLITGEGIQLIDEPVAQGVFGVDEEQRGHLGD